MNSLTENELNFLFVSTFSLFIAKQLFVIRVCDDASQKIFPIEFFANKST